MIILPAIDIKDGNCVRLFKGDYATVQKVAESPYIAAQGFADAGAEWMHMVDLDGAKDAKLVNADLIADDAKDGMVRAEGWIDNSEINYIELAKRMENVGVKTIVFTDIDQDGTLAGPNLKQLNDLAHEVSCNIIASGGVAVLKDIINLSELDVYGAICGKAIYTGSLDLKQAIEVTNKI